MVAEGLSTEEIQEYLDNPHADSTDSYDGTYSIVPSPAVYAEGHIFHILQATQLMTLSSPGPECASHNERAEQDDVNNEYIPHLGDITHAGTPGSNTLPGFHPHEPAGTAGNKRPCTGKSQEHCQEKESRHEGHNSSSKYAFPLEEDSALWAVKCWENGCEQNGQDIQLTDIHKKLDKVTVKVAVFHGFQHGTEDMTIQENKDLAEVLLKEDGKYQ
ncbi:hypothetical protein JB92DRAFT_2833270 [Gautieria morchelliformis]|nr:hypothetical protein JB92DRAFT_2833270 [Gautieria morchelliformis]